MTIDIDALKEAIDDFEQYTAFMNAEGGKLIIDAARLVLAAVPAKNAFEAALTAYAESDSTDFRDDMRAALIAAGVHRRVRMPTREKIAETIAKRDGAYANYEDYLEDADRILALLGGTT